MLAKLFDNNRMQAISISLGWVLLVSIVAAFHIGISQGSMTFLPWSLSISPVVAWALTVLVVPLTAMLFNFGLNVSGELRLNQQLALLCAMELFIFMGDNFVPELMLALPLIALALVLMVRSYSNGYDLAGNMYDIGLLIGLITLFFPWGISIFIISILALLTMSGTRGIRAIFGTVLGILTIWLVVFSAFYFLSDFRLFEYLSMSFSTISNEEAASWEGINPWALLPVSLTLIPVTGQIINAFSRAKIKKRRFLAFWISALILSTALSLFLGSEKLLYLAAFPLAVLQVNALRYIRKWWYADLVLLFTFISYVLTLLL